MVKVIYNYQDYKIIEVIITGHANFSEIGKDLVCAGISAIIIGALNAIQKIKNNQIKIINNNKSIKLKVNNFNKINKIILTIIFWQLKTIEEKYPKYINIKKGEKNNYVL